MISIRTALLTWFAVGFALGALAAAHARREPVSAPLVGIYTLAPVASEPLEGARQCRW